MRRLTEELQPLTSEVRTLPCHVIGIDDCECVYESLIQVQVYRLQVYRLQTQRRGSSRARARRHGIPLAYPFHSSQVAKEACILALVGRRHVFRACRCFVQRIACIIVQREVAITCEEGDLWDMDFTVRAIFFISVSDCRLLTFCLTPFFSSFLKS